MAPSIGHFVGWQVSDDLTDAGDAIGVIQCAGKKRANAGCLVADDGREVHFVGDPGAAPRNDHVRNARPDDLAAGGRSYRDVLEQYNREQYASNPWGLLPAWYLYARDEYGALVRALGAGNVFILSAGWGLVAAEYLLPYYDITFSQRADQYKRRRDRDRGYRDFSMLPPQTPHHVYFFGGTAYVSLFCRLTENVCRRTVFLKSKLLPKGITCRAVRYKTRISTVWHYNCVRQFVECLRELGR